MTNGSAGRQPAAHERWGARAGLGALLTALGGLVVGLVSVLSVGDRDESRALRPEVVITTPDPPKSVRPTTSPGGVRPGDDPNEGPSSASPSPDRVTPSPGAAASEGDAPPIVVVVTAPQSGGGGGSSVPAIITATSGAIVAITGSVSGLIWTLRQRKGEPPQVLAPAPPASEER